VILGINFQFSISIVYPEFVIDNALLSVIHSYEDAKWYPGVRIALRF
jgi:hypothetical protein